MLNLSRRHPALVMVIAAFGLALFGLTACSSNSDAGPITSIIITPSQAAPAAARSADQTTTVAPTATTDTSSLPSPVTAGTVSDNLPTYTCAADAFGSYYTLQVIQQAKLDVAHGFHLAIVPFLLDGKTGGAYDIDEDRRVETLAGGRWDCLLTTLDSVALHGDAGEITALVDESAGADQFWVKSNIKTLNDLRGQKIAVDEGSVGEFFAYYVLSVAGITPDPATGATIIEKDSVPDAVSDFNSNAATAVSGWEPDIEKAADGQGRKLIGTDSLRVVVDVIVTARQTIAARPDVVQDFHDAWFDALKLSAEDFGKYADDVAAWGHNDWSAVSVASAKSDLAGQLDLIAQASLDANSVAMKDPTIIQNRLDQAKRVWAAAGKTPSDFAGALIEPKFVLASAGKTALQTTSPLHNNTFYMTSHPTFAALSSSDADKAQTLGILPCRTFEFDPGSYLLTDQSRQTLDQCAIPILQSSPDVYLAVLGSAAWPIGETEASTRAFAMQRAQSVADYLVSQGIDKDRLVLQATVPPPDRRNLGDDREEDRKKDRFVQLTLLLTGR